MNIIDAEIAETVKGQRRQDSHLIQQKRHFGDDILTAARQFGEYIPTVFLGGV